MLFEVPEFGNLKFRELGNLKSRELEVPGTWELRNLMFREFGNFGTHSRVSPHKCQQAHDDDPMLS